MAKVYVVTSGSYSDYGISAVFDRRELAEAMIAGKEDYGIEEYTLNPGESEYHEGRSLWHVRMRSDGSVERADDLGWAWDDVEPDKLTVELMPWDFKQTIMRAKGVVLEARSWARDQEQAVKAVNERRAEWIASGRWAEDEAKLRADRTWFQS